MNYTKKLTLPMLGGIFCVAFFLFSYGIQIGVPYRWLTDEVYAVAVRILASRSLVAIGDAYFYHPIFYPMVLAIFLCPYFLFLKISGYPLQLAAQSANISWTQMAFDYPELASGIILWSRFFSVLLGVFCCYIVYRLGKEIFQTKVGLLAAMALAMSMDFGGSSHFAMNTPVVTFLVLFSVYSLIHAYTSNRRRYLKIAFLFAGFAASTKITGLIVLVPLWVVIFSKEKEQKGKTLAILFLFFLAGSILGNPKLFITPSQYWEAYTIMIGTFFRPGLELGISFLERCVGLVNYLLQVVYGIGIPLSCLVLIGVFKFYCVTKDLRTEKLTIGLLVVSYWVAISFSEFGIMDAPPKGIVLISPYLALLAGIGAEHLLSSERYKLTKRVAVIAIFCYSFWYCLAANLVLIRGDTRYYLTRWIKENIPPNSTIELFNQINRCASEELYRDYQILFGGLNSVSLEGRSPFKNFQRGMEAAEYYQAIQESGPQGEYVIVSFDFYSEVEELEKGEPLVTPERLAVVQGLLKGKYPFQRLKEFLPKNNKRRSQKFPMLSIPISFWENPISNMGYISPIIYVYQKTQKE